MDALLNCVQHSKLLGWFCKYVFVPLTLRKYAVIDHYKYEGAYLLSKETLLQ